MSNVWKKGDDTYKAIQASKQLFAKYYNADDAASLTKMYTSDATVIAPNYGPIKGHKEIQAGLKEELALGKGVIGVKTMEVTRKNISTAYRDLGLSKGKGFEELGVLRVALWLVRQSSPDGRHEKNGRFSQSSDGQSGLSNFITKHSCLYVFPINSMHVGKKDFENEFLLRRRNPFSREMGCAILEEECRSRLADRERFPPG